MEDKNSSPRKWDKVNEKIQNKWLGNKKKVIHHMRRPHIVSSIFAFIVLLVVTVLLFVGFRALFITVAIAGETVELSEATYVYAQSIEDAVGSEKKPDIEAIVDETEGKPSEPFMIISEKGKTVYTSGDEFNYKEFTQPLPFVRMDGNKIALDDTIVMTEASDVFSSTRSERLINELISRYSAGSDEQLSKWMEQTRSEINITIRKPIADYKYSIIVLYSIPITNRDALFLLLMQAFGAAVILLPIFFYVIVTIREITSWKRMSRMYYFDPVCMGKNWTSFVDRVSAFLKKRKGGGTLKYAMVCLHFDKYRNYCICYGTNEGEWLLGKMYILMHSHTKKKEFFARNNGGEFGMLLKYTDKDELADRLEKFKAAVKAHVPERNIDFSAGICEIDEKGVSVDEWYYRAGLAQAAVDGTETGRTRWFDQKMLDDRLWERHVEELQQKALDNNEFVVYVQPKYSPSTDEMTGGEALIRWNSPEDGLIPPGRFIPIFEKNNFIINIDDFMIEQIAKMQSKWISEGRTPVTISVNLSRVHFADPDLAEEIVATVDKYGVPHHLIELEITESAFFDDREMLLGTIGKLKDSGFELSMDDFGTGYSSMNSLKELPLDVLKLDASFFRGADNGRGEVVVSDAISLARHLDMQVVAEGVETQETVDFLKRVKCDMIQGYYYAKPMPADEFAERLVRVVTDAGDPIVTEETEEVEPE
ncbi:MAG: EAL domain-containing protein [Clostridiales bacterium]|nr:EAL domain-containing protein [Clostridiales bacterium]